MAVEVSSGGLRATATRAHVAECAMHRAQQIHIDAWVAAAAEMSHEAIRDTDWDFTSGASVARRTTQRSDCGVTAARAGVARECEVVRCLS